MVADRERPRLCLWNFSHRSPVYLLAWNRNLPWPSRVGRRNGACNFCLRDSTYWRIFRAHRAVYALSIGSNLFVSKSASEHLFARASRGGVSNSRGHSRTRPLSSPEAIPPLLLDLFDGLGTFVLGILIVSRWPPASEQTIPVLVGLSLILTALSRVFLSLAARALGPTC